MYTPYNDIIAYQNLAQNNQNLAQNNQQILTLATIHLACMYS